MTEGLGLAASAKIAVAEGFQSNDMNGVSASATAWNGGFQSTKYVSTISIATATGIITVTYNGTNLPQVGANNTLLLSPFVGGAALATGQTGNIDWACSSASHATATSLGMAPGNGTVAAKYVPTQCK